MRTRFDGIFLRRTGFATLDRLLARLHANKAELLMVLERPEIPLHTNSSENDIRCQVTRRKVSAGTRSDIGRDCRDAFLSLVKTCDKLGIAVWDYLGSRFKIVGHAIIEPLDHYVRARSPAPVDGRKSQHFVALAWHSGAHGIPVPVVLPLLPLFELVEFITILRPLYRFGGALDVDLGEPRSLRSQRPAIRE